MVSSTYYDLREVRQHLRRLIDDGFGYRALISEDPSFPIDPDVSTIENCRRVVEHDVDVLILLVGRRYGTAEPRSQKSVTNLEYAAARAKGIPVYAFFEQESSTLFEAWRSATLDNRPGLESTVDDARLFTFMEQVRSETWVSTFRHAQDLGDSIRIQFAYMTMEGLTLQRKVSRHKSHALLASLSPTAFRIAIERGPLWEPALLAEVLDDEVRACADLRREYDYGLLYGNTTVVPDEDTFDWLRGRLHEPMSLINNVQALVEQALPRAFAPPGVAGDADEIVFVARQIAKNYRGLIEWTQAVRRTRPASDDMAPVIAALSRLTVPSIVAVPDIPRLIREHRDALFAFRDSGQQGELPGLTLHFNFDDSGAVTDAMQQVLSARGIDVGLRTGDGE